MHHLPVRTGLRLPIPIVRTLLLPAKFCLLFYPTVWVRHLSSPTTRQPLASMKINLLLASGPPFYSPSPSPRLLISASCVFVFAGDAFSFLTLSFLCLPIMLFSTFVGHRRGTSRQFVKQGPDHRAPVRRARRGYAAFDPTTVITHHGPYSGVAACATQRPESGWAPHGGGPPPSPKRVTFVVPRLPCLVVNRRAANPNDQTAAANSLCATGSADGIKCAVVAQPGNHDWPFAARASPRALPVDGGTSRHARSGGAPAACTPAAVTTAAAPPRRNPHASLQGGGEVGRRSTVSGRGGCRTNPPEPEPP